MTSTRVLAGVLAVALLAPTAVGALLGAFTFGIALARPDPSVPNGDPCCWHPDTWWEVAGGTALGAWTTMAAAAVGYLAWRLARFAGTGSPLTPAHRARATAAVAFVGLWFAVALIASTR